MNKIAVESDVRKERSSLINGTNDREAYPKRWVAALVQMNCEKKVASKLDKLGITNYVPIQKEVHQWSDRKKIIDRIVIPMVVFVHLSQNEENDFKRLPFIFKFITYPGSKELATPIPDSQINCLKFMTENADCQVTIEKPLQIGDNVQIIRGPLKGLIGKLCRLNGNKQVVAILLDCLGYACVEISINDIINN